MGLSEGQEKSSIEGQIADEEEKKVPRREKGTGGITQRKDGRWVGRFDAGVKADGKRDVRVVYGKTKPECKRKLKELIREIHRTDYVAVPKQSAKKFMETWLNSVKRNDLKPKSFDRLEQTLKYDVYPYIGSMQLKEIKSEDIQDMINKLRDKGKSYSSIKKAYEAVNAAFKYGVIAKKVQFNPAFGVTIPSKKLFVKKEIPCYTAKEAAMLTSQALSNYKNGKRHYPMGSFVPFLLNTGLRLSEFLALKWEEDIDLDNRTVTVHSNLVSVKDRSKESGYKLIEQKDVKTEAGQNRVIPLNDSAYEALLDMKTRTGEKEYVMMTETGKHVRPADLDQMFRRIAKASGLPEEKIYGVHALRHTFATLLLSNNVDIKTVSTLLGHSDVTITYNTYIHIVKEQAAKALNAIPELLKISQEDNKGNQAAEKQEDSNMAKESSDQEAVLQES